MCLGKGHPINNNNLNFQQPATKTENSTNDKKMNPESGAYDAQKDFGLMQGSNNIIEQCLDVAKINDPESIFC